MRFMEGSRFPLNLMLWIDRSHDGRGEVFTVEVFDGQPLYLGRGDCLYPADVLFDDTVVRAAEEVFDRHVGDAERSVEDAHHLARHDVLHQRKFLFGHRLPAQPFDFVVNFPKCRGRHLGSDLGSDSQVTLPLEIDHGGTHAVRVTVLAAQVLHQPRAEIAAQYRSDDLHPDEIGMCAGEEQTPYAQRGLHGVGPFDETIGFAAGSRKIGCGAAVGTGEFFGQGADALQLLLPDAAAAYDQTVFGRIESAVE